MSVWMVDLKKPLHTTHAKLLLYSFIYILRLYSLNHYWASQLKMVWKKHIYGQIQAQIVCVVWYSEWYYHPHLFSALIVEVYNHFSLLWWKIFGLTVDRWQICNCKTTCLYQQENKSLSEATKEFVKTEQQKQRILFNSQSFEWLNSWTDWT